MSSMVREPAPPTPVSIVSGFLGSGKTTLIAGLLRHAEFADTALIVNEIGEVGLDHMLLERLDGDTVLLPQGCVCCTLSGTVGATLESLDVRRVNGEVPNFNRVIVETTGLAKPAPIMQELLDRNVLLRGYTPGLIATTVDAANGAATLFAHEEAVQQVAMADRLLLTKTDLAADPALLSTLRGLNPHSPIIPVRHGDLAPDRFGGSFVQDLAAYGARARSARFIATAGHAGSVSTFTLCFPEPLDFERFADWLGNLAGGYGAALLRVKGIVRVRGQDRPVVVHGVQRVFHPPTLLDRWPPDLDLSTLVFIVDDVDPADILASAHAADLRPQRLADSKEYCDAP